MVPERINEKNFSSPSIKRVNPIAFLKISIGLIMKIMPSGSSAMKNGSVRNNTNLEVFLDSIDAFLDSFEDFAILCFWISAFRISITMIIVTMGNRIQGMNWNRGKIFME